MIIFKEAYFKAFCDVKCRYKIAKKGMLGRKSKQPDLAFFNQSKTYKKPGSTPPQ
jgi:hypothetical protein